MARTSLSQSSASSRNELGVLHPTNAESSFCENAWSATIVFYTRFEPILGLVPIPHFYFHERMLAYDFGPRHPLQPERVRRFLRLLGSYVPDLQCINPGPGEVSDVLRVHAPEYVDFVARLPDGGDAEERFTYGFGSDTPPFPGIHQAALDYTAGAAAAARAVCAGAPLAFSMAGGLHHARRAQASGFCTYDDCAVACSVLRDRFDRVAYIDIDLHHGDGVQWIFYDEPTVMTYSVHETGRSLYPGTGFVDETGAGFTKVNVPLQAGTTGEEWLEAVTRTLGPAVERFRPQALVFQMGCDPHLTDPLGHLEVSVQHWLGAVKLVRDLGLPTVALGGGGYDQKNVPRMWTGAVLTLLGWDDAEFGDMPEGFENPFGTRSLLDPEDLVRRGGPSAKATVEAVLANVEQMAAD